MEISDIAIGVLIVKVVFVFNSQHNSLELNPNTSLISLLLLKILLNEKGTLLNYLLNYHSNNLLNILSKDTHIYLYFGDRIHLEIFEKYMFKTYVGQEE